MKIKVFKQISIALIVGLVMISTNSCMITKTPVGEYKQQTGKKYKHAQGKQVWLFWGLIPLGRTSVSTPSHKNCMIRTGYTFGDVLVRGITGGIISTYTIRVFAKREDVEKTKKVVTKEKDDSVDGEKKGIKQFFNKIH